MNKYKIFILIALILTCARFAYADFAITEIMYDPSGADGKREWIEVQNTGTTPDDLSKWFLFSDDTKHSIASQAVAMIAPGAYAVVAQDTSKFKADWPSYNCTLFDSSWTDFNNKGESIAFKDPNGNIKSSVVFTSSMGGAGNGDSLQLIGNAWQGASPTPGAENKANPLPVAPIVMPSPVATTQVSKVKEKTSFRPTNQPPVVVKVNKNSEATPIDLNNLGASAENTKIDIGQSSPVIAWIGLLAVIIAGIFITLHTKKKIMNNMDPAKISASDITILE